MAHLDVRHVVHLELTKEEFRLVSKALAGRLDGGEVRDAGELNLTLLRARDFAVRQAANQSSKALETVTKNCHPKEP